jgi:imidazolonepropionase-like amidohydrolase
MTTSRFGILLCSSLLLPLAGCPPTLVPDEEAEHPIFAFVHVNVIPMDRERVLTDQTVLVRDDRIDVIGPASGVEVPAGAVRIEAAGRYLLPAFCDMHVHLLDKAWGMILPPDARAAAEAADFGAFLFPYVAHGVTTVQVLMATPDHVALRERIRRGEVVGPRLLLARMIDGPDKAWPPPLSTWVSTAEEARRAVLDAKKTGYDSIKVYSFLGEPAYDAIIKTAREVDLPVIGHVPMSLSVERVLASGQVLIAHAEEIMKHAGGDFSAARLEHFAGIMIEHGAWMTPTLVATRAILAVFDDLKGEMARPEIRFHQHPVQQGVWSFLVSKMYEPVPADQRATIRHGFEQFQRPFTKLLHASGGRLMAGTDTFLPTLVPGFALHRELEEMTLVGLSPYAALRTSTTTPFDYLGERGRAGTIEIGKRGDLVLLEKNPLVNITHSRTVAGVLVRGHWLSKKDIQQGLDALAKREGP